MGFWKEKKKVSLNYDFLILHKTTYSKCDNIEFHTNNRKWKQWKGLVKWKYSTHVSYPTRWIHSPQLCVLRCLVFVDSESMIVLPAVFHPQKCVFFFKSTYHMCALPANTPGSDHWSLWLICLHQVWFPYTLHCKLVYRALTELLFFAWQFKLTSL